MMAWGGVRRHTEGQVKGQDKDDTLASSRGESRLREGLKGAQGNEKSLHEGFQRKGHSQ